MLVTALTLPEQISRSSVTCTGQNACSLETALISILSLFSSASWYLAYQDMLHLQKNVAKEKLITTIFQQDPSMSLQVFRLLPLPPFHLIYTVLGWHTFTCIKGKKMKLHQQQGVTKIIIHNAEQQQLCDLILFLNSNKFSPRRNAIRNRLVHMKTTVFISSSSY